MVDSVCRNLRDGVLQGEFAPALMLLNHSSALSAQSLLLHVLASLTSDIVAGSAQPKCIVLVAAERSPEAYQFSRGLKEAQLSRLRYIDCFNDPLGWKRILNKHPLSVKEGSPCHKVCNDLRDLHTLYALVLQSGTLDNVNSVHFSVAIDSISSLLGHTSIDVISKFLNNLRSHGQISSVVWTLHSKLHDSRVIKALEYISSVTISIEESPTAVVCRADKVLHDVPSIIFNEGLLRVRQKRRNGRVREQVEKFKANGFSLSVVPKREGVNAGKTSVPQVQFRLQLSDKEREERAKVILPFEHQGNGRESLIYNGRAETMPALLDTAVVNKDFGKLTVDNQAGQVEYVRDSDEERPDSDEDPDDDLDI